eukprot:scaffold240898_cov32-Tisochrysis_lutea.AAC.2
MDSLHRGKLTVVEQSRQRKAPKYSSGRTSLVRVTVPVKLDSTPTFSTLHAQSFACSCVIVQAHTANLLLGPT